MEIKVELTKTPKAKPAPGEKLGFGKLSVSYTHLTLPTNREV